MTNQIEIFFGHKYLLISLLGLYFIVKEHKYIFFKKHLWFIALLIINYLLSRLFISFNLQITYQRDDYTNRILQMIGITLLPIFLTAVYFLCKNDRISRLTFPARTSGPLQRTVPESAPECRRRTSGWCCGPASPGRLGFPQPRGRLPRRGAGSPCATR